MSNELSREVAEAIAADRAAADYTRARLQAAEKLAEAAVPALTLLTHFMDEPYWEHDYEGGMAAHEALASALTLYRAATRVEK